MTKIHKSRLVTLYPSHPDICTPATADQAGHWPMATDATALIVAAQNELALAREQVDHLLATAREQAAAMLTEVHLKAAEINREAFASGYQAGLGKARLEQAAAGEQLARQVQAAIELMNQQSRDQLDLLEPEILELSLQVAEKVIDFELSRHDQAYSFMIRSALRALKQSEQVKVRISDQELADLTGCIIDQIENDPRLRVVVDSHLPKGSCILESESGTIDASVAVQLQTIRRKLQPVLA